MKINQLSPQQLSRLWRIYHFGPLMYKKDDEVFKRMGLVKIDVIEWSGGKEKHVQTLPQIKYYLGEMDRLSRFYATGA